MQSDARRASVRSCFGKSAQRKPPGQKVRRLAPAISLTVPIEERTAAITLFVPFGDVNALELEDYRARAIVAAADHLVLPLHPSPHNRSALQARVDVARDGIPRLGAVRAPWAAGDGIGVGVGSRQRAKAALPEMVLVPSRSNRNSSPTL